MVAGFMGTLNDALTIWFTGTPLAPFAGIVDITVGGTKTGAAAVVNVHV